MRKWQIMGIVSSRVRLTFCPILVKKKESYCFRLKMLIGAKRKLCGSKESETCEGLLGNFCKSLGMRYKSTVMLMSNSPEQLKKQSLMAGKGK